MIPVVTPDQMEAAEEQAAKAGYATSDMMSRAASAIANWVDRHLRPEREQPKVVALVGPGNNGGDGLVALVELANLGWRVAAVYFGRDAVGELPINADAQTILNNIETDDALQDADVVLDAIFGFRSRPSIPDAFRPQLQHVAAFATSEGVPIVAVDVPSGIDAETGEADPDVLPADVTLAIQFPKLGAILQPAAEATGELIVLPIGIDAPDEFSGPSLVDQDDARSALPKRSSWSHKTGIGGVMVIGGGPGYYGAPRLSGESALRSGAGYVGVAVPRSIVLPIATTVPELVIISLSDIDAGKAMDAIRDALADSGNRYRCLLIGPGLGQDEVADQLLSRIFARTSEAAADEVDIHFGIPRRRDQGAGADAGPIIADRPLVIDADALNWLARQQNWPELLSPNSAVLTPHAGEIARLLGESSTNRILQQPYDVVREAAIAWQQTVVLKVGLTCAATPDGQVIIAPRATPELATPGTGDVLAGMIASFIGQELDTLDAVKLALYVGATAGHQIAQRMHPNSVIASDLIDQIPRTMLELTERREGA